MTIANKAASPMRHAAMQELLALHSRLVGWLVGSAYPLWAEHGIDPRNGGFVEMLAQDGVALAHPRRARVQPRQIYAFAQASAFGWPGDTAGIVTRGIEYFEAFYRRPDGLFRTLAGTDGAPLDNQALLYDQAFALLGYAAAATALGARSDFEQRAIGLYRAVENRFRGGDGAFHSDETGAELYESNPHMHLLEACLAWADIGAAPLWADAVRDLTRIATTRLIRADSGALGEAYGTDWRPAPGIAGRIVEPGHQFEWAWLLLRAAARGEPPSTGAAALRLLNIGERHGVRDRVVVNSLLDDFTVHEPNARFWPQTERLKAALLAARHGDEERYWPMAVSAAQSLLPYLQTPIPGLWWDLRVSHGGLVNGPAPASTFYHLVGAIKALQESVMGPDFHSPPPP